MKHPEIAPGTVVFVARKGLTANHPSLFEIEKRKVIKTTAKGYRLNHGGCTNGLVYTLDKYYVHPYFSAVASMLQSDIQAAETALRKALKTLDGKANDISHGIHIDCTER